MLQRFVKMPKLALYNAEIIEVNQNDDRFHCFIKMNVAMAWFYADRFHIDSAAPIVKCNKIRRLVDRFQKKIMCGIYQLIFPMISAGWIDSI